MVTDFGVAKALHRSLDGSSLTGIGVTIGTPAYMAPEQAVGDPAIDHRADLYALGVLAFEMLAGRTPFSGPTVAAMVSALLSQPAPLVTSEAPGCPPRLADLIDALLAKDPAQRPANADDVRDTLRSILVDVSSGPIPTRRGPMPTALTAPFGGRRPRDVFELARSAANRALALDSTVAEAHTSLGIVAMFYDWDWPTAATHLARAVELNPSYAEGHLFYGWYLLLKGRAAEARAEVNRAHALDQLSVVIATRRATMLQYTGRDAEAIPFLNEALELDSTFFHARADLAESFVVIGQADSARRVVPRAALFPGSGEAGVPVWVLVQLGDTATARRLLAEYEAAREHTYVAADALAGMYAAFGDSTRALNLLEQAAEERAFTLVFLANYRMFNSLHKSARFRRLVDRIGVVPPP